MNRRKKEKSMLKEEENVSFLICSCKYKAAKRITVTDLLSSIVLKKKYSYFDAGLFFQIE